MTMAEEGFLVTTLPHTAVAGAPFHLSLFITHRLTPDGASGFVSDFPRVADWTALVGRSGLTLTGHTAGGAVVTIPATMLTDVLQPDLWRRVFPGDLTVLPWQVPNHTATPWRTFAAHRMQAHALLMHAAAMAASPTAPPSVSGNPLTRSLLTGLGLGQREGRISIEDVLNPDLDDRVTRYLDDVSGQGILGRGVGVDGATGMVLLSDVHRARCYYARPEEQHEYHEHPVPGAKPTPVTKPDPDFHARATLLGDLSPLLRRLGLIIDVHVDDVGTLAGLVDIQAHLIVPELDNVIRAQPRTACEVVGSGFYSVAAGADYTQGLLRIGDEKTFTVLDLDPDASALKLEQYVRTLPRLAALEANGDAVTSAPSTLRATGFAVARVDRAQALHDRLDGAAGKDAALVSGFGAALHTEDVTRGVRVEVWDDVSGIWHSLHRRRLDVEVEGAGEVLHDEPDTGFLQGASLTRTDGVPDAPANAHEVLAGWDGWSLSASRPGKVVVNEGGEEHVVDAPDVDPDPVNPVASTTRVRPGTLPRLRYGRRYAFRAWTADLAGNSSPHTVAGPDDGDGGNGDGGDAPDAAALDEAAKSVATAHLAGIAREATVPTTSPEAGRAALEALRAGLRESHPIVRPGPRAGAGVVGVEPGAAITGHPELDRLVLSRRADVAGSAASTGRAVSREVALQDAFATHAMTGEHLLERTDAQTPIGTAAAALVSAALSGPASGIAILVALADLVTTPRLFLRWDPVLEPAVVPRHPYSEGESQLALAIRSGVDLPVAPGDAPVVVAPDAFLAATTAAHPELDLQWQATAQRHLAPPKASQYECELHGRFDDAIGGGTAEVVRRALALAMREAGSFLEDSVADLDNPGGRIAQPGVSFHATPTAETPAAATPADLTRGDPLTPGQYVIHDVDELVVPYLPDPLATGISLVFPDAGLDTALTGLLAVEGTTLPFPGSWPTPTPFRLVLTTGDTLGGRVEGNVLEVTVPPGEQLRLRLSSSLNPEGLDLLGLWRSLPQALRDNPLVAQAAADGWFWWLTPGATMRLVHAVPRPVEAPRVTLLLPFRLPGETTVNLVGAVDVHGPSTERLDVEASWTEQVDDIAKPGPETVAQVAAAAHTQVRPDEDLVVLFGDKDADLPLPDGSTLHTHSVVHKLGDTRHRRISYAMRATTRYREYFDPRLLPTPDDVSIVGPTVEIDVPSSARPAKGHIRDTLPLFRWSEETEPNQPFALRRTRGCGVRIYLDRPWFSSGDGELLGVLTAISSDATMRGSVSEWGADPVFLQQGPASRAQLPLLDLLHLTGFDDRIEGGRPVGPPVVRPLIDLPGAPSVFVVSYQPEFSNERGLWFVDIALDPGTAFWPFVRFALARHQPSSVGNLHLSPVLRTDFVQLTPPRTATLSRPEAGQARLVVTGPVGVPRSGLPIEEGLDFAQKVALTRVMRARLERRAPSVNTDLGWTTEAAVNLPVLGVDDTVVSWTGTLDLPVPVPPRLPGQNPDWRVVLEEWELLPADSPHGALPRREARIVYADHLPL
jgi:hypothetical protein